MKRVTGIGSVSMVFYDKLKTSIAKWLNSKHQTDYAAISEILDYNYNSKTQALCYLRKAQCEALKIHCYSRQEKGGV